MITAIVRFKLPATMDAAKAAEVFQASASRYQGLAGLVRKYYLFDAENRTGGGCYLWESREAAERVYNAELAQDDHRTLRRAARDQFFRDAGHYRQHPRQDYPRRGGITAAAFAPEDRQCPPIRFCGTSTNAGSQPSR